LSRYQRPEYHSFTEPELVWTLQKDHHIGLITVSTDGQRIQALLNHYMDRIFKEFHSSLPPRDKALD
jgi:hypothetical protein